MVISKYLDEDLVVFLEDTSRDGAIKALVSAFEKKGCLGDVEQFHTAILEREKIVSTGIGIGVAIPHAKIQGSSTFFIAVGVQKEQGIEWNALDGSLVRLVFMIGGPDNKQTEYLRILSALTQAIKEGGRRKRILSAKTPADVLHIFRDF